MIWFHCFFCQMWTLEATGSGLQVLRTSLSSLRAPDHDAFDRPWFSRGFFPAFFFEDLKVANRWLFLSKACFVHVELLRGQSMTIHSSIGLRNSRFLISHSEPDFGLLFRGGGFLKPKMLREFPDPITGFPLSTSMKMLWSLSAVTSRHGVCL